MLEIQQTIETQKERLLAKLLAHPFLTRCREGRVNLEELRIFLVQQGIYSSYFTRYLCAMMANLPSNAQVFELAENLFEELGFAENSPTPHYQVYHNMLASFGLSFAGQAPTDGTRRLIDTMFAHCRNPDPAFGLGALCLGAEALVPAIYSDIIRGFEQHAVPKETIWFFHLHVDCDDGHAETIAALMAELVGNDHASMHHIVSAGDALVDARCAFFDGVEAAFLKQETAVAV